MATLLTSDRTPSGPESCVSSDSARGTELPFPEGPAGTLAGLGSGAIGALFRTPQPESETCGTLAYHALDKLKTGSFPMIYEGSAISGVPLLATRVETDP